MKITNWRIIAFFSAYLVLGLATYKDYGISFDEPINRANGIVSIQYVGEKLGFLAPSKDIPKLQEYYDRDYGVVFDIPLVIGEKALGYNSDDKSQQLYHYRHLMTFLVFFLSTLFFYATAASIFTNKWLPWLGTLFLMLSPRIFAESFYNSKDIVCLSAFIISTYFLLQFLKTYAWRHLLLFSICTAIAINIRLTGIIIPVITLGWGVIDGFRLRDKSGAIALKLGVYAVLTAAFMVMFWPFLWEAPLANFQFALANMSKFRANIEVLFFGERMMAMGLPWYYIIGYVVITTPLLYLVLWILGVVSILKDSVKRFSAFWDNFEPWRTQLTFLVISVAPFALVILLNSTLYDGWRQLYFTYGAFLMIALYGLDGVFRWGKQQPLVMRVSQALVLVQLVVIGGWMFLNHPFQQTYFNMFAGQPVAKNFEIDYWGLSYKQGLEWIVQHDKRPHIKVIANLTPGVYNRMILDKSERERLDCIYLKPSVRDTSKRADLECDYFITEFRYRSDAAPYTKELHSIKVDGNTILAVYDGHQLAR
ncbi:ArnT family glycosyltransferase [Runella limosa]|uniref:ArnT family glycosyltransferase n=1 Tax=Runella limosa TaxID=370978 RepID=UPI00040B87BE|nr:glycosyltransferase family 39 protein [Runella limosa]